jgi:hypothetical protein
MADIPSVEPLNIVSGDTVKWTKSLSDYKASAGWTLKYNARGAGSINLTASASGDDYLITIPAATSAGYTVGTYKWNAYVEKDSERYTVAEGYFTVAANLAAANNITDRLITLQTDIDAINAFLGKNYKYSSYSIAGRSLANYSISDLYLLKDRMQRELNRLRDENKLARGVPTKKLIRVRFNQ